MPQFDSRHKGIADDLRNHRLFQKQRTASRRVGIAIHPHKGLPCGQFAGRRKRGGGQAPEQVPSKKQPSAIGINMRQTPAGCHVEIVRLCLQNSLATRNSSYEQRGARPCRAASRLFGTPGLNGLVHSGVHTNVNAARWERAPQAYFTGTFRATSSKKFSKNVTWTFPCFSSDSGCANTAKRLPSGTTS